MSFILAPKIYFSQIVLLSKCVSISLSFSLWLHFHKNVPELLFFSWKSSLAIWHIVDTQNLVIVTCVYLCCQYKIDLKRCQSSFIFSYIINQNIQYIKNFSTFVEFNNDMVSLYAESKPKLNRQFWF